MNDKEKLYLIFTLADIIEALNKELVKDNLTSETICKLPKSLETALLNMKFGSRDIVSFINKHHPQMASDFGITSDKIRDILEEFVCAQR